MYQISFMYSLVTYFSYVSLTLILNFSIQKYLDPLQPLKNIRNTSYRNCKVARKVLGQLLFLYIGLGNVDTYPKHC